MRFEFVRTGEHGTSVKRACGALGVSRGGYYAFLNRPKSSRQIAHEALEPFVEDIFYANNRRYGSRRIVVKLRKIGIVANGKTVQRMMARKGLASCRGPKKYRRGGKASDKGANVLNREFSVQKKNSVWCGDITYIPTRRMALPGHLPRPVLSQDSRMASAPRINENLVIDALDNAVNREIRKKDSWCTRIETANTPRAGFAGSSRIAGSSNRFPARAALTTTPSWSRSSRP